MIYEHLSKYNFQIEKVSCSSGSFQTAEFLKGNLIQSDFLNAANESENFDLALLSSSSSGALHKN